MVKKKNNKNNSPQWLKEQREKSKNQELITVSIYDYDFQRYEDENILSESVKAGINNYNGSEDDRNFLEKVYYHGDFGTKKVFPYLIQEMQQYTVEDRHQRTSRFFNILTDLKTIESLNRFFLDIGKPKLIPNEIAKIINLIPDDLPEIKQTLIKSLLSCEKQIAPEQNNRAAEDDLETEKVEDEKNPKSIKIEFGKDNRQIIYNEKTTGKLTKPQFFIIEYLYKNGKTYYTALNKELTKEFDDKNFRKTPYEYFKKTKHEYVYKELIESDNAGSYFIKFPLISSISP